MDVYGLDEKFIWLFYIKYYLTLFTADRIEPKPLSISHSVEYKHNYIMLKIHTLKIHILAKFFSMLRSSNKFSCWIGICTPHIISSKVKEDTILILSVLKKIIFWWSHLTLRALTDLEEQLPNYSQCAVSQTNFQMTLLCTVSGRARQDFKIWHQAHYFTCHDKSVLHPSVNGDNFYCWIPRLLQWSN